MFSNVLVGYAEIHLCIVACTGSEAKIWGREGRSGGGGGRALWIESDDVEEAVVDEDAVEGGVEAKEAREVEGGFDNEELSVGVEDCYCYH